ncbi:hypothetical protein BSLG_004076 [Batrachochytrium salamandrivorans]|nr:hypothetical protein BASA81_010458 [Batrachochytrium salamandrivorans]KAJ1341346.1 hypothetical protein BSLG_004076 [Batrachochytrium salamandrivorans]
MPARNSNDEDLVRRAFLATFSRNSIPDNKLTVQYSRSSGPGGQNVNKVNTKVDIRFVVRDMTWAPDPVIQVLLEQNASKINKRGELVITSDRFRTQQQNYEDCFNKLYSIVVEASQVADGPSMNTIRRVEHLKVADSHRRMRDKQFRSAIKNERRGHRGSSGGWD